MRIMDLGATSVLDVLAEKELETTSLATETEALRREVVRLADTLFPTPQARAASRLYQRLTSTHAGG